MTTLGPKVDFQPVEMRVGSGWFVRVTLPRGEPPRLGGFKTEAEATEWIKRKSAVWVLSRSVLKLADASSGGMILSDHAARSIV
jgi:hypothetical protein